MLRGIVAGLVIAGSTVVAKAWEKHTLPVPPSNEAIAASVQQEHPPLAQPRNLIREKFLLEEKNINAYLGIALLDLMQSPHPKLAEAGKAIPTLGWTLNLYGGENGHSQHELPKRPLWGVVTFPTETSWNYALSTNENLLSSTPNRALELYLFAAYQQWQNLSELSGEAYKKGIPFVDYLAEDDKFSQTEAQAWKTTIEEVIIKDKNTGELTPGLVLDGFTQDLVVLYAHSLKQREPQEYWSRGFTLLTQSTQRINKID